MLQRSAINQSPSAGDDYPFARQSDAGALVQDFYLSYQDLVYELVAPFRLVWLFGFGTIPVASPPDTPTPAHDRDLLVLDANDVIVFDSTTATGYTEVDWGDRLIVEWRSVDSVARIVFDTTEADNFNTHEVPDYSVLDPRTCALLPLRVTSLRVGTEAYDGTIDLAGGYNVDLTPSTPTAVDGGRFRNQITISAAPGGGIGRFPGCEDADPLVRTINTIQPASDGAFTLDVDTCFRLEQVVIAGDNGYVYGGHGLSSAEAKAALLLGGYCTPCCPCDYYVRTYNGLILIDQRWRAAMAEAGRIRDLYAANKARWLAEKKCRHDHPFTLFLRSGGCCILEIFAALDNVYQTCLRPVEFRFSIVGGTIPVKPIATAYITGSHTKGVETPYSIGGGYPHYVATFPTLGAGYLAGVRFRLRFTCLVEESISVIMNVHYPDPDPPGDDVPNLGGGDGSDYPLRGTITAYGYITPDDVTAGITGSTADCSCDDGVW